MKKFFLTLLFGFLFGSTIFGLISPAMISWYFDPPTAIGISCKDAVVWGIGAYQKLLVVGGVIGLFIALVVIIASRKRSGPPAPPLTKS